MWMLVSFSLWFFFVCVKCCDMFHVLAERVCFPQKHALGGVYKYLPIIRQQFWKPNQGLHLWYETRMQQFYFILFFLLSNINEPNTSARNFCIFWSKAPSITLLTAGKGSTYFISTVNDNILHFLTSFWSMSNEMFFTANVHVFTYWTVHEAQCSWLQWAIDL
jgi:hypothetical protein